MQPQGLSPVNPDYFAELNAQVKLCNSCSDLQILTNIIVTDLSAFVDAVNSQLVELAPLIALVESPPTNPIAWISEFTNYFLSPYIKPYATYLSQAGQIVTQFSTLVATITAEASRFGCSVNIPALPAFMVPGTGGSGAQIIALANGHGTWDGGSPPQNVRIVNGGSGYISPTVTAYYPLPSGPVQLLATTVTLTAGVITNVIFPALPDGSKPNINDVGIGITDVNVSPVTIPLIGSNTSPGIVQGDGVSTTIDPITGVITVPGVLVKDWQPQGSWQFPLGTPNNEIFALPTKVGYKLPAGLAGSIVEFETAPASDWTATFFAGITSLGSVTVPAGLTTGVITFPSEHDFTGELFRFVAPATADGSASGLSFLFIGTRTS